MTGLCPSVSFRPAPSISSRATVALIDELLADKTFGEAVMMSVMILNERGVRSGSGQAVHRPLPHRAVQGPGHPRLAAAAAGPPACSPWARSQRSSVSPRRRSRNGSAGGTSRAGGSTAGASALYYPGQRRPLTSHPSE